MAINETVKTVKKIKKFEIEKFTWWSFSDERNWNERDCRIHQTNKYYLK